MAESEPSNQEVSRTTLTIRCPDDFHHHCRDGAATVSVLKHAYTRFRRCLMMPNLQPPVTTTKLALEYKERILQALQQNGQDPSKFQPLMTLYLTDKTSPEEIVTATALKNDDGTPTIVGCKYYPAGATTNSDFGVTDVKNLYPVLEKMQEVGMMLCIHSEVTHADIFEREPVFIEEIMKPLVRDFPTLKITMEHISTKEAVEYVLSAPANVKASITCHHLIYNRNHMLVGGIRPHLYCLPILKAEIHRQALVEAATSGSPKFFLGTDSAPHATHTKESACGCAGVYSAHCCIEIYAEAFEEVGKLDRLEDFCSSFGADHYGLPRNTDTIVLEKKSWTVPKTYEFGEHTVTPLKAGEEVKWTIVEDNAGKRKRAD
ncbi:dihydroorotase [Nitzschia inconspicua]|uniref:Dihydroorotase n=1 Tax=Nitzschia inconspicua TaxID=303405 RepID=A0A9K3L589_9STRA|nr:dihydroorotase [Nitzschia inconspicua]